jgi:hypothetical protein
MGPSWRWTVRTGFQNISAALVATSRPGHRPRQTSPIAFMPPAAPAAFQRAERYRVHAASKNGHMADSRLAGRENFCTDRATSWASSAETWALEMSPASRMVDVDK